MIELPQFPAKSVIGVVQGKRQIRLRWPRRDRLAAVRIALPSLAVVAAIGGPFAAEEAGRSDLVAYIHVPSIVVLVVGILWYWLGKPRVSTIILREDTLAFVAPPKRVFPGLLRLLFGNVVVSDKREWEAERQALRARRKAAIPRSDVSGIEDLGARRGISVEAGGETLRFGAGLRDDDRELLAETLRRWATSGKQPPG